MMSLTERDKAIIKDLNRFRVMDRDSITELHFSICKKPKGFHKSCTAAVIA
jgi:hypothetical protein